jgi:serine/threonine protein kinase
VKRIRANSGQHELEHLQLLQGKHVVPLLGWKTYCQGALITVAFPELRPFPRQCIPRFLLKIYMKSLLEVFILFHYLAFLILCLKGVAFIHSKDIVHMDLKQSNLLLDGDMVKICDFGSSCMCISFILMRC